MKAGEVQLHECEDMSVQASFTQVASAKHHKMVKRRNKKDSKEDSRK